VGAGVDVEGWTPAQSEGIEGKGICVLKAYVTAAGPGVGNRKKEKCLSRF